MSYLRLAGDHTLTREMIEGVAQFLMGATSGEWFYHHGDSCRTNVQCALRSGLSTHIRLNTLNAFADNMAAHQALNNGNVLYVDVTLQNGVTGSGDHHFLIVPDGHGNARVVHSWEQHHILREEVAYPINTLIRRLRNAMNGNIQDQVAIFGDSPINGKTMRIRTITKQVETTNVAPNVPPNYFNSSLQNVNADLHSRQAVAMREYTAYKNARASTMVNAATIGGAFAFVVTLGQVLYEQNKLETVSEKAEKVGVKTAIGAGAGAAGARAAGFVPSQAVTGGLVNRSGLLLKSSAKGSVAAGVVFAAGELIYGSVQVARGKWSIVDYRKTASQSLGGGAGGIVGGIAGVAAVVAVSSNPAGWLVGLGGLAVGVVGGIGGAVAGGAIDGALWDNDTDVLDHMFWFFDLGSFRRKTPVVDQLPKTEKEQQLWIDNFNKKMDERNEDEQELKEQWQRVVMGNYIELLSRAYPDNWEILLQAAGDHARILADDA